MRRLLLTLCMLLPIGVTVFSMPLSPEQAMDRALRSSGARSRGISASSMELAATINFDGVPAIYSFNNATSGGFIVVSADDASEAVLGYSDEGTIAVNPADMPDGLCYWLECLAEDIHMNSLDPGRRVISKTPQDNSERSPIEPLVTTKWNQGAPFNDKCPQVNGNHCVTGCVATATAQVLAYYKYPVTGTGSFSYTWNGKTLSFDYGNTTFDWDNMIDEYKAGQYTQTQSDAVATLMYACGVGVQMGYGVSGSGAYTGYVADELVNYFGYPAGVKIYNRNYYSIDAWNDLVYSQLQDCGPLQFAGRNSSAGHSFVCDGANGDYFHFNWGWGGMSDGYFLLTALNPGSQGIGGSVSGYTMNQYFIGNVNPTPKDYPICFEVSDGLNVTPESGTADVTSFTIDSWITNNSGYTLSGGSCRLGIKLRPIDPNKGMEYIAMGTIGELPNGYGYHSLSFNVSSDLEDGAYRLTPAFRIAENGEWNDMLLPIDKGHPYYTLVKEGDNITLTPATAASITVNEFALDTPLYLDQKFMVSVSVTNNSDQEYLDNLCVVFLNDNNQWIAESLAEPVDLMPGVTHAFKIFSNFLAWDSDVAVTAGNYEMYLAQFGSDYSYTLLSAPIDVTIEGAAPEMELTVSQLSIPDNQPADRVHISGTLECLQGYFCGNLTLAVFFNGSNIYQADSDVIIVSASTNSGEEAVTNTAPFQFIANLEPMTGGDHAMAAIYYYKNGFHQISSPVSFTVDTPVGIESVNYDEANSAAEYYDLSGRRLGTKPTIPGFYILRETLSDGHIRTRRVIVH